MSERSILDTSAGYVLLHRCYNNNIALLLILSPLSSCTSPYHTLIVIIPSSPHINQSKQGAAATAAGEAEAVLLSSTEGEGGARHQL